MIELFLIACGSPPPSTGQLEVLTYNIHGLPPEITGDDTQARVQEIAGLLGPFDVVGLQEDFIDENHVFIESASEHQTHLRFSEPLDNRAYGSGLSVLADYALLELEEEYYTDCFGVLENASDCLASKGFQVATISLGDNAAVDIYNTHLEAGGSAEDNAARATQVDQLISSLNGHSKDRAVLFLGDTNLHATLEEDALLLSALESSGGLSDSCALVDCNEPNHIDRILIRNGALLSLSVEAWQVEEAFYDSDGVPLSDHPAISATIGWDSGSGR